MSVKIGHASIDEKGKIAGGAAGDQTKKEVCTRGWYDGSWNIVLRFKDSAMAEKVALAMEKACKNDKIGYDQNQRNTLLTKARKVNYDPARVTEKCETDCSALVSLCCMYAGISENALFKNNNSATTSTLKSRLAATNEIKQLSAKKYLDNDDYLKRGDIILREGYHVAVVLEDGDKVKQETTKKTETKSTKGASPAKEFDEKVAGTYTTTTKLKMRKGAGKDKEEIVVIPKGKKVRCYGYYTVADGTKWLLVTYGDKYTGFCCKTYLK